MTSPVVISIPACSTLELKCVQHAERNGLPRDGDQVIREIQQVCADALESGKIVHAVVTHQGYQLGMWIYVPYTVIYTYKPL